MTDQLTSAPARTPAGTAAPTATSRHLQTPSPQDNGLKHALKARHPQLIALGHPSAPACSWVLTLAVIWLGQRVHQRRNGHAISHLMVMLLPHNGRFDR